MGNSAGIGMKHYVELVDAKAAREYWSIKPIRSTDRKIVADCLNTRVDIAILVLLISPAAKNCFHRELSYPFTVKVNSPSPVSSGVAASVSHRTLTAYFESLPSSRPDRHNVVETH